MNFPFFLALKYLRPRRDLVSVIPIITTLGVCLGVAILLCVLAVMTGFGDQWNEIYLEFKPHITIHAKSGNLIADPDAAVAQIEKVSGVKSVCPAIITPVMLGFENGDEPIQATIIGIDPERESILSQLKNKMYAGTFDVSEDNVVLGAKLADNLGVWVGTPVLCYSPLNLNTRNELYLPEEMNVAGVFWMGMQNYDSQFAICSLGMAREITGLDGGASIIQVQLDDPIMAWRGKAAIAEALGPMFTVNTWQEEDELFFTALKTEKTMMVIILSFISIVAAFCVMNTLILITIQKTNEIGLLKALGFSNRQIESAFVLNGMIQCVVGEALGVALALVVLRNIKNIINWLAGLGISVFPPEIYGLAEFPWRIVPSDVIAVTGMAFLFSTLAAYIPAWRAARLDPVKAINN
ncbi:MAG: ABC transporter permease [Kiritimatiellaeota bacterium]|nr:ABC transporter permease [Kiritimatiellota bacterium]